MILRAIDFRTLLPLPVWVRQFLFLLACLWVGTLHAQDRLLKKDLEDVLELVGSRTYPDFRSFLNDVEQRTTHSSLRSTLKQFRLNSRLTGDALINLYRLTGIYVRIQYRDGMLDVLKELVEIPTDSLPGVHQYENPNMIRFGKTIERISREFGLDYRNADNRVFEVILKGSEKSGDSFGIYTHADVVPADAKDWVLEDGTALHPYKLQIIGDKIYGRGTEDDKASIAASLFAMKAIREAGLKLRRDVRLIIETTEEIGGSAFAYYQKKYPVPDYNVVLDNLYPVVTAEKGFLLILADFKVRSASGAGVEVVGMTGGTGITSIPSTSTVSLRTSNPSLTRAALDSMARSFIKANGNNFRIECVQTGQHSLDVTVIGVSAHSSTPESGVNPLPLAMAFIHDAMNVLPFRSNHFTDAIRYGYDNYGLDLYGRRMGIDYADDFMGPLTVTLTTVTLTEENLQIGVSGRPPRGKAVEELQRDVETKLSAYRDRAGLSFESTVKVWDFMYRNPEGKWIHTLLNIFGDITGLEARPVSANGGTTAKFLPNAVSFGPGMPGEKYMGHTANEFKKLDNFFLDAQMFTEMILRISNLDSMVK
jgi:predicted dipeptidase